EMIASANSFFLCQILSATRATRRAEFCATTMLAWKDAGAADRMIMEAELAHRLGLQQVSSIEYDRRCHPLFDRGKIDIGKFTPFRRNHERFGTVDGFQCRRREFRVDASLQLARFLPSFPT